MRTKGDAADAGRRAMASFSSQCSDLKTELNSVRWDQDAVQKQLDQCLTALADMLLPEASVNHLQRMEGPLKAPFLLTIRQDLENQRSEWGRRLSAIDSDPDYRQREELLAQPHGTLWRESSKLHEERVDLESRLGRLEVNQNCAWALKRLPLAQARQNLFTIFWRGLTLAETRERRAQSLAAKELGYASWPALLSEYEALSARALEVGNQLVSLNLRREKIQALVTERAEAEGWANDFENRVVERLRAKLALHLGQADMRAIHAELAGPAQRMAAQIDALSRKVGYFRDMSDFLSSEARDRELRAGKISNVVGLWRKRPYERLGKDQTLWLVTGPKAKLDSTRKQLSFLGTLRAKIRDFNDYEAYNRYLNQDARLLAYDVFAFGTAERMPYEGFTTTVIKELAEHRRQGGKADYGRFKVADKEDRLRAREQAREEARRIRQEERQAARDEERLDHHEDVDDTYTYVETEETASQDNTESLHDLAEVAVGVVVGMAAAEAIHEALDAQMSEGS